MPQSLSFKWPEVVTIGRYWKHDHCRTLTLMIHKLMVMVLVTLMIVSEMITLIVTMMSLKTQFGPRQVVVLWNCVRSLRILCA